MAGGQCRGRGDRRLGHCLEPWRYRPGVRTGLGDQASGCRGVLVAVEEGALELDDEAGPPGATVAHLLAHASGLAFDSRTVMAPPATQRIYSSAGFEVLAETVEAATGIDFAEYLRQSVCELLGMTRTVLDGPAGHGARSSVADWRASQLICWCRRCCRRRCWTERPASPSRVSTDSCPVMANTSPTTGARVRDPGAQESALDRCEQLAGDLRSLRAVGDLPVGRPTLRPGVRGAHRPAVRCVGQAVVERIQRQCVRGNGRLAVVHSNHTRFIKAHQKLAQHVPHRAQSVSRVCYPVLRGVLGKTFLVDNRR